MSEVTIHKLQQIKLRQPFVILGLPGTGLVGSVAASQLVDALKMPFVGYISSPEFAPLAAIHNYTPLPAARIHVSEKHNLVVVLSEMTIPVNASLALANKIYEFAKSLHASMVICLGGVSLQEEGHAVYAVSSDRKLVKPLVDKKLVKPIREGATSGVSGVLLARGNIEHFPIISILAESSEEYLDPEAASQALKVLSAIIRLKIDTKRLDTEAKEISEQLREKVIKSKLAIKRATPEGGMYG
ncbi:MAG TPA: PAC2 family protein [Candidatus Bilamarchaeaceae archaeon]|nr:PAC2 family protein [Candidatus Bilamarchaeaceae archaeon]